MSVSVHIYAHALLLVWVPSMYPFSEAQAIASSLGWGPKLRPCHFWISAPCAQKTLLYKSLVLWFLL